MISRIHKSQSATIPNIWLNFTVNIRGTDVQKIEGETLLANNGTGYSLLEEIDGDKGQKEGNRHVNKKEKCLYLAGLLLIYLIR